MYNFYLYNVYNDRMSGLDLKKKYLLFIEMTIDSHTSQFCSWSEIDTVRTESRVPLSILYASVPSLS